MLQKRIATVQDISCFGKCSLSAAISVISAFGIEAVALPTAVLSTHTGAGFCGYTFRDLTEDMRGITEHWSSLGIEFDAMYSGYLGSIEQIEIVEKFFLQFKTDKNFIFIDPVMGDGGELYAGFDNNFVKKMYSLCSHADIICPNVTEAALLSGIPYEESHDTDYVRTLAHSLRDTGAKVIVITGLSRGKKFGAFCLDTMTGREYIACREHIPGTYYGTGDLFSSVMCSSLASGFDIEASLKKATDFVYRSILNTQDEADKYYYGVKFEPLLSTIKEISE